jgi:spore coat protein U-like protein
MKRLVKLWLAAACIIASAHAGAATCAVAAVSLAFGNYNPFRAAHADTNGNIAITCNGVSGEIVAYTVALSAGASGTPGVRRMRYGAVASLSYNLYTSTARTTVWGDGNAGTLVVSDSFALSGSQAIRNYPVYGRTFARQNAPVGLYSDSIVVTLNF